MAVAIPETYLMHLQHLERESVGAGWQPDGSVLCRARKERGPLRFMVSLFFLASLILLPWRSSAESVVNGDFEYPVINDPEGIRSYTTSDSAGTDLRPGW